MDRLAPAIAVGRARAALEQQPDNVSLLLTRAIKSQIWGVSSHDPITFGAVLAVLIAVGITACLVPARRATQVDPLVALRVRRQNLAGLPFGTGLSSAVTSPSRCKA